MKTFLRRTGHVFFKVSKPLDVKISTKTEISQDNDSSHCCVTKISGNNCLLKIASIGLKKKTKKQKPKRPESWYFREKKLSEDCSYEKQGLIEHFVRLGE